MNKRRLTFKRVFDAHTYHYSEPTITARFDSFGEGETNQLIIEPGERKAYMLPNGELTVKESVKHFLVGEVANRLYEYEELGYSPEELKEIIDDRKKLKERLNSLYGASAFDGNVESLYPRLFVARANGKSFKLAKAILAHAEFERIKNKKIADQNIPEIDNVIFNDPATIIFWKDGTKTVVKAENEDFDPEKGLAMAISKKALGNQHEYYDVFKKWLKKFKPYNRTMVIKVDHSAKWLAEQRLHNALHDKKATKADLRTAMEEAIKYLNNEKEN